MKVRIWTAEEEDVRALISMSDYANVLGAKQTIIKFLMLSSVSWVGFVDNKPACVWGLIPPTLMSETAYLWMLSTELVEKHKFLFVRHSQIEIEKMLEEYPVITGHAVVGNSRGIRWLKWLGAEFLEPEGMKVPFVIRKKHHG